MFQLSLFFTLYQFQQAIDELISLKQNSGPEEPELEEGEWQMMWNSQVDFGNPKECQFPIT